MRHGDRLLVAGLTALALVVAVPVASAQTGTVAGTLSADVPKGDRGTALVRAIQLGSGVVAGADRLERTGRYALRVPPGPYVIAGTVIDRKAKAPLTTFTKPVAVKDGQQRKVTVKVRRKKTKRKRRRRHAKAAYVQEDGTVTPGKHAVRFQAFSGATGDFAPMNRGLSEMWLTDVMEATQSAGCPVVFIASEADLVHLRNELDLQQSPAFDPATRVRRNFILPDLLVGAELRSRPGGLAYAATVKDARTGVVVGSVAGEIETSGFFDGVTREGRRLAAVICRAVAPPPPPPPPPPDPPGAAPPPDPPPPPAPEPELPPDPDPQRLSGPFSGSVDYRTLPGTPLPIRLTWSGTVALERQPYGFQPFVDFRLESGSVTATLEIRGEGGECDIDGTGTFDLVEANGGTAPTALLVDLSGDEPRYTPALGAPMATILGVKSNCTDDPEQNGKPSPYPLAATPLIWSLGPLPVASRFAYADTVVGAPIPGGDPEYHWTWSLSGQ